MLLGFFGLDMFKVKFHSFFDGLPIRSGGFDKQQTFFEGFPNNSKVSKSSLVLTKINFQLGKPSLKKKKCNIFYTWV